MSTGQIIYNSLDNNMLICVYSDKIVYSISDENNQILLRQDINMLPGKTAGKAVYEHFFNQPELNILSENVSIVFENSEYQLVPNELFGEENMTELFEIEFGKLEGKSLKYILLPKWGVHLVFSVQELIVEFFEKKYPDAVVEHHVSLLLKKKIQKRENAVYANIRHDAVDILVVMDNMLRLATPFDVKTNEDICYFILNCYEQLQLDMKKTVLNLFSETIVSELVINLLKEYVSNVNVE